MLLITFASFSLFSQEDQSVIKIESAQNTEYRKNKETGTEEIILTGAVKISVTKGSTVTSISADSITFNRTTDMVYAVGNVSLQQTGGSAGGQNITASSLLFNTSTLEGIFDNGRAVQTQSDAINLPSGSTLIVASEIFGRDSSSTIAFKNAELTFCDEEDPHWKIWASRIWLLPGGEFAFFNAVLFVGHVPLLYLPAFYYPKDELIFNPSFGYDERLGYYFNTTTYIFGRKPLDTSSDDDDDDDITKGLFNFMKATSLKEQKREGLVLHNLDDDFKGNTTNYLKIMADFYTNLGFMFGAEGVYKPGGMISNLSGNVNIAFTQTIFETGGLYSNYYNEETYSDKSNFLGVELPFRYSAGLNFSMTKPFTFTLAMPVYSDPYFTDDFSERSEYIDWLGFLMNGDGSEEEDTTSNTVTSFTWTASGSYNFTLPDFIKPYISSLSISSFSSSLVFSSKSRTTSSSDGVYYDEEWVNSDSTWRTYTPERTFFYPSQVTPFKVSAKIAGTLIQLSSSSSSSKKSSGFTTSLNVPDEFKTPEEIEKEKAALQQNESDTDQENVQTESETVSDSDNDSSEDTGSSKEDIVFSEKNFPSLTASASSSVTDIKGLEYTLSYSITPQYTSQINYQTYDEHPLYKPEDFDWSYIYSSYYQVKVPATLTSKLSYRSTFASMSNTFTFNPVYQTHPNLDGYSETSAASVKKTDYAAKKLDLTNSNTVSVKPLLYNSVFKNTSIDWSTTVKLIETEFLGDADDPQWEYNTVDLFDDDCFTTHTLSGTLSAVEGKYSQTLTLSTKLPPQVEYYSATFKLGFPVGSMSFASSIQQVSSTDESYEWNPFQQSATIKLGNLSLTESYNYDLDEWHSDSFKFSATWNNFKAAYVMSYVTGYDFDKDTMTWTAKTDKEFQPYSLTLSYASSSTTYYHWLNRISWTPKLSTSIVYDCLKPTNSYFTFVPSMTFKINDFLDLTFSAESRNSVIFRYIQKYTDYGDIIGGETNPLIDLYNSFKFWDDDSFYDSDQSARKGSGYKIKSFSVSLSHDLCDWDMAATLTFKPRTVTSGSQKYYDYHPYFSFSVSWRPMSSMKTEIVDEYGEWELNP
ncbi:hypothetical protein [Treponema sp.]|uniref:hypothetical protein n=1 Tax=Treponema sp. TaxID=166 RepID=UPI0025E7713B|nr:hypothetical protein [Treponema sp.]MCR5218225.1 hypothetical protein [Treponema sp.]